MGTLGCVSDPPPFAAPHDSGPIDAFVAHDVGVDAADVGVDAPDTGTDAGCTLGTTQNCLTCGNACGNAPNTTPTCTATGCANPCNMGFDDCDMVAGNGCEVATGTDIHNCGSCGMECTFSGLNVSPMCAAGTCVAHCQSGYADCNGDLLSAMGDGCEININTAVANCGSCGNLCTLPATAMYASPACSSGTCRMQCMAGHSDCNGSTFDGCEVAAGSCP
jgi:hypothetical protein